MWLTMNDDRLSMTAPITRWVYLPVSVSVAQRAAGT
jgi:hypothetical protein